MNVFELVDRFPTEDHCRAHLEQSRWPEGVRCPRCGHDKITRLARRRQFTCAKKACRYRFSATADTIMHASKLPLRKWFLAIAMLADAKKSMSSLQLSRHLKISKERAWHLTMRIRAAMAEDQMQAELFKGIVAVDDHYTGGATRPEDKAIAKRGRGAIRKQAIMGAYEKQSGRIRTTVVPNVSGATLAKALQRMADLRQTELHSDEWFGYRPVGRQCKGHRIVNHSREYVAPDGTHTNHVENVWSLFARSVMGSFHKLSVKHLPRYLSEFDSRFNARRLNGQYFDQILRQTDGRRLSYDSLVNGDGGAFRR